MNYEDVCYINVEGWSGAEQGSAGLSFIVLAVENTQRVKKHRMTGVFSLSSSSGHAEEHTGGSPGPPAPADGPD